MKREDIKPFVAHIKCDADYSDIETEIDIDLEPTDEVERVRVEVLDGPLAGCCAWINLEDTGD